jgi:hypothetical protein
MSDGTVHEVSGPHENERSTGVETPRWPSSAAVLEALAALEAEFDAILNRRVPASE